MKCILCLIQTILLISIHDTHTIAPTPSRSREEYIYTLRDVERDLSNISNTPTHIDIAAYYHTKSAVTTYELDANHDGPGICLWHYEDATQDHIMVPAQAEIRLCVHLQSIGEHALTMDEWTVPTVEKKERFGLEYMVATTSCTMDGVPMAVSVDLYVPSRNGNVATHKDRDESTYILATGALYRIRGNNLTPTDTLTQTIYTTTGTFTYTPSHIQVGHAVWEDRSGNTRILGKTTDWLGDDMTGLDTEGGLFVDANGNAVYEAHLRVEPEAIGLEFYDSDVEEDEGDGEIGSNSINSAYRSRRHGGWTVMVMGLGGMLLYILV